MQRRSFWSPVVAAVAALTLGMPATAQTVPQEIRIGWAVSKTGPYAGGASTTVIPNYEMWRADLEKAGGIEIDGKKVPVRFSCRNGPVKAHSVPCPRNTVYCSGVSSARHSASVRVTG